MAHNQEIAGSNPASANEEKEMKKLIIALCSSIILAFSTVSFSATQYNTYYFNKASSHKGHVEAYVDNNLQEYWMERGAKRIDEELVIIPNQSWNQHAYDYELVRLSVLHEKVITGAMDKFDRAEQYWTDYCYFQKRLALESGKGMVAVKHFDKMLQQKLQLIADNREAEMRAKDNDWRSQLAEQRNRNEGRSSGAWYYENGSKYLKDAPGNNYHFDNYPNNYYPPYPPPVYRGYDYRWRR